MKFPLRLFFFLFAVSIIQYSCSDDTDPVEICDNTIDDDGDGVADCKDADCNAFIDCASNMREVCDDGVDDDGDSVADCEDADCNSFAACNADRRREICNNEIDDDSDGLVDCNDPDCNSFTSCITDSIEICNNGLDDDGDFTTDCYDRDCISFADCAGCPPDSRPIVGADGYEGRMRIEEFPDVEFPEELIFVRNQEGDIRFMHTSSGVFANENAVYNDTTGIWKMPLMTFNRWPVGTDTLFNVVADMGEMKLTDCFRLTFDYLDVSIGGATSGILQGVTFPLENVSIRTSEIFMH